MADLKALHPANAPRGHGRSGGRGTESGWYGDADVAAAVSFLRAQPDVDDHRIAVAGMSMGGEQALGAAEDAVVTVAADNALLPDERTGVQGGRSSGSTGSRSPLTDLFTDAQPPTILRGAAATMAPRPVLLITAGSVADEARAAAWTDKRADTVQVWTVDEADQRRRTGDRAAAWERRVTAFLEDALAAVQ